MSDQASQFVGAIPDHYDRRLGPQIFVDFAADLARRIAALNPARLLETAAGTGILTRMLYDRLPRSATIVATDLNAPMLEIARSKFAAGEAIELRAADATDLPFEDGAFDAIACQFGVMFFPDKDKACREAIRVLRPGGTYIFNVWDSFDFNPFARVAHETVADFFEREPPRFYFTPFGYWRIDPIKSSLIAAGFSDISIDVLKIDKAIPSARRFAEGLIFGNPVLEEIQARAAAGPETIVDALAKALQRAFGDDPGRMPLQAILFRAVKR